MLSKHTLNVLNLLLNVSLDFQPEPRHSQRFLETHLVDCTSLLWINFKVVAQLHSFTMAHLLQAAHFLNHFTADERLSR